MKSRSRRCIALLAGIALSGCAHAPAGTTGVAGAADDEAVASLAEHHRHHHHGGVTQFIALSLESLGADSAKAPEIEKIKAALNAEMAPARDAEKTVILALADGIAAGTFDTERVNAAISLLASAAGATHVATAETVNQLHALLSPAERASLVDKIHAHWAVWWRVNGTAEPGGLEAGGRLASLADELALTPEQTREISASVNTAMASLPLRLDPGETQGIVGTLANDFVADSFDDGSLSMQSGADSRMALAGATRMALFYETVNPFLTPGQRTQLAADLRDRLTHQQANSGPGAAP